MAEYFEHRTRSELKNKYKREQKHNADRMLNSTSLITLFCPIYLLPKHDPIMRAELPSKFDDSVYDHVIEEAIATNTRKIEQQQSRRERARERREQRLKELDPARYARKMQRKTNAAGAVNQLLASGQLPPAGHTPADFTTAAAELKCGDR